MTIFEYVRSINAYYNGNTTIKERYVQPALVGGIAYSGRALHLMLYLTRKQWMNKGPGIDRCQEAQSPVENRSVCLEDSDFHKDHCRCDACDSCIDCADPDDWNCIDENDTTCPDCGLLAC